MAANKKFGEHLTKELNAKGGRKSGEVRREKRKLKEELEILLGLSFDKKKETNQEAISTALINEAIGGNVKAFEVIRDTIGQKPIDKQEINTSFSVSSRIKKGLARNE